jgi:hypothetical protein
LLQAAAVRVPAAVTGQVVVVEQVDTAQLLAGLR